MLPVTCLSRLFLLLDLMPFWVWVRGSLALPMKINSLAADLGLLACCGAEGSCWKSGLHSRRGHCNEGQTNLTVDAAAIKELEECHQWASGLVHTFL